MIDKLKLHIPKINSELELTKLSRINMFAGKNDSGKTTILKQLYKELGGHYHIYSYFKPWFEEGSKTDALLFLQKIIPTLQDIEEQFMDIQQSFSEYIIKDSRFNQPLCFNLGNGLSRMFMMLHEMFIWKHTKYIFIDDFEMGIDTDNLDIFVPFFHEVVIKYDLQVFLSTHSKECIDVFATRVKPHSDMCYIGVVRTEENFPELVETTGMDLRRTRTQTRCFEGLKYTTLLNVADADLRKAK